MRIVILTNNRLPGREGIGRHVTEVGRRLLERGHRVTLLAPNDSARCWQAATVEGLPVERYPHLPLRPLHHMVDRIPLQHWLDLHAAGFDLLHVHLPLFPPLRCSRPTVVTFHTPMLSDTGAISERGLEPGLVRLNARLFSRGYEQWYLDNATAVLAVSAAVQAELEASYRTRRRRIHVVENGVDLQSLAFVPYPGRRDEILYVGRLGYRKGLPKLLGAFASLAASIPHRLVLVGEGPLEGELREQAEVSGIARRVEFTGFLDREAVRQRLQAAALFVSPSEYEGFPLTLLEAMAAGAPVVTTRTGPLLADPTALPVHTTDSSAAGLAEAIVHLLSRPDEAAALALQARTVVEQRHDWNHTVDALESVFRDAVRIAA